MLHTNDKRTDEQVQQFAIEFDREVAPTELFVNGMVTTLDPNVQHVMRRRAARAQLNPVWR